METRVVKGVQEEEIEAVQLAQPAGQVQVTLGGQELPCLHRGRLCTRR